MYPTMKRINCIINHPIFYTIPLIPNNISFSLSLSVSFPLFPEASTVSLCRFLLLLSVLLPVFVSASTLLNKSASISFEFNEHELSFELGRDVVFKLDCWLRWIWVSAVPGIEFLEKPSLWGLNDVGKNGVVLHWEVINEDCGCDEVDGDARVWSVLVGVDEGKCNDDGMTEERDRMDSDNRVILFWYCL